MAQITEKQCGADHPEVASALNNLAEVHRRLQEHDAAFPLYKRALAIREKVSAKLNVLASANLLIALTL